MTTACWRVASASERGSSHRGATPNQDAVGVAHAVDADGGQVWVAAVADGHGGRRYVRSDIGARMAVDCAIDVVGAAVPATTWTDGHGAEGLLRDAMPQVVASWRAAVQGHLAEAPFTEDEEQRAGVSSLDRDPLVAYGATLITAVVGTAGVAIAQIGDGDVLVRTSGFAIRPVPGDSRLVAGETTSLCLDTADSDFRFAALPASAEPDLVLLASDGYGNSFASADWWHGVVDDLARFVDEQGFDTFSDQFSLWLAESALVGGDDVSSVVLIREPLAVEPADHRAATLDEPRSRVVLDVDDLPPARTLIDPDPPAPAPGAPPRRSLRRWLLVAAALVLVVGAVVATVLLRDRTDGGRTPIVETTTSAEPVPADGSSAASDPGRGHLSGPSARATNVGSDKQHPGKRQRR